MSNLLTVEAIACPNCKQSKGVVWGQENGYTAERCGDCGLVYVNPRPTAEAISEANKLGMHDGEQVLDVKARRVDGKVAHYKALLGRILADEFARGRPIRWLDVGAGYGEVVEAVTALAPTGSVVEGLDPMAPKVAAARARGLEVSDRSLADIHETYDVISLINVYSHIPDFDGFLSLLASKLKPGGLMVLETGNGGDLAQRSDFPGILYLPDHLVFSGVDTMTQTFERGGFKVEHVEQQRVDNPVWCVKETIKNLLKGQLKVMLPGQTPYRTVIYRARLTT